MQDGYRTAFLRLGIIAGGHTKGEGEYRVCPICTMLDELLLKTMVFRRIHQVEYVEVCPFHNVKLVDSDSNDKLTSSFCDDNSMEKIHSGFDFNTNSLTNEISRVTQEIIRYGIDSNLSLEYITAKYNYLLWIKGYKTQHNKIRMAQFSDDLRRFYAGCNIVDKFWIKYYKQSDQWIEHVFRGDRKIYPFFHVMIIVFLAGNFTNLIHSGDKYYSKFGNSPWPCLNMACPEYLSDVIWSPNFKINGDDLIGTFTHDCGFSYVKHGERKVSMNRYEYDRVLAYGDLWIERLRFFIENTNFSVRRIASYLNCDSRTVMSYKRKFKQLEENKD